MKNSNLILALVFLFFANVALAQETNKKDISYLFTKENMAKYEMAYKKYKINDFQPSSWGTNSIQQNRKMYGSCWDEIDDLTRVIEAYKKIHYNCYLDDDINVAQYYRLVASLARYKESNEEWSGWCKVATAFIFIDLAAFVSEYQPLTCLED